MRLIDADALMMDLEKWMKQVDPTHPQEDNAIPPLEDIIVSTLMTIEEQPTVDAVSVVRCKDCRFHEQEQPGMVYCPATVGGWVEENWFCKGGERRSE